MDMLKKEFSGWSKLDYLWLLIANGTILGLSLYWGEGIIPIVSALTGVTCVIFVSKQMMLNYYVGAINVALYAYLAFQSRLYGDFMLNALYYFPMQFIGIYMWNKAKGSNSSGNVETKILSNKERGILALISIAAIAAYSVFLSFIGGNIPVIDATSTVLSVIAMILMVKQYLEQWYLWVVVNTVSIAMWGISLSQGSGDFATLLMWTIYLLNSLFGLYNWRKEYKKNDTEERVKFN